MGSGSGGATAKKHRAWLVIASLPAGVKLRRNECKLEADPGAYGFFRRVR